MQIIFHSHQLKLRHTFAISRESYDIQPSLIVELKKDGQSGYGEATANPYYKITVENMISAIEDQRDFIESLYWDEPSALWAAVADRFGENTFALCALDEAAYDLWGKLQDKPVHKLWGLDPQKAPVSNYTIGIDTIQKMVEKLKEFPWPIYKIKLGTKDDLQIIRELRKHTSSVFRVDANCAWSARQTIDFAPELKKLGVEFIEQPMKGDAYEEMREVKKHSVLPLIADESCIVEGDVEKCADAFHGINIKLTKCGGLTPARRMINKARAFNLKVMVGCMTESSVGISALAQLAPMLDYVDMDGAMLLAEDIAKGVIVHEKGVKFSDVPGNGTVML